MIVDRINTYLESEHRTLDEGLLAEASKRVGWAIKRQLMQERESSHGLTLSTPLFCLRRAAYQYHKVPGERPAPRVAFKWLLGDVVETGVLTLAKLAGCDIGEGQGEVKMSCNGQEIRGHIDALMNYEGKYFVVEIKSVTQQGMDEFERGVVEWAREWDYWGQAHRYANAVAADGVLFVVVCRDTGHMAEMAFPVDAGEYVRACESYPVIIVSKEPADVARGLSTEPEVEKVQGAKNVPPDVMDRAQRNGSWWSWETDRKVLNVKCGYCGHRALCWKNAQPEIKSGKPVWVVEE